MVDHDPSDGQALSATLTNLDIHLELIDLVESIQPLSNTVVRLASLVADEECDFGRIEAVLRDDPAVVAGILHEANSAASASVDPIQTARAALTRLGLARVLAIAVSNSMGQQTQPALEAYRLEPGALQAHMTKTSYIAEAIRGLAPELAGPEVVTAALLHHVGLLVLDKYLKPGLFQLALRHGLPVVEAERELSDVDHAELGALMLEAWNIPRAITNAVRYHHAPASSDNADAHIVCLASLMADEIGNPDYDRSDADEALFAASIEALGIDESRILERSTITLDRAGLLTTTPI